MATDQPDADGPACLRTADAVASGDAHLPWSPGDQSRHASLIRTLEGEIVPRLLMLSRSAGPAKACVGAGGTATVPGDVEELARVLLAHCPDTAQEFVEAVRQRGVPHDGVFLGLLIPVARRLAERWERRELSHQQLAAGLNALQAVVLDFGAAESS